MCNYMNQKWVLDNRNYNKCTINLGKGTWSVMNTLFFRLGFKMIPIFAKNASIAQDAVCVFIHLSTGLSICMQLFMCVFSCLINKPLWKGCALNDTLVKSAWYENVEHGCC